MDPIAIATITSAVSVLANEVFKGTATEAGKDIWEKIKNIFDWKTDPSLETLPVETAQRITSDTELAKTVVKLIQNKASGRSSALVGRIDAEKVIVISNQTVEGDFNIQL